MNRRASGKTRLGLATVLLLTVSVFPMGARGATDPDRAARRGASGVHLAPGDTEESVNDLYDSRLRLDSWTTEDGLPLRAVDRVLQSAQGYLWLATQEGLVRFDGYDFDIFDKTTSSLTSNSIYSLYEDAGGTLWIGTRHAGLFRFRQGKIERPTQPATLQEASISTIVSDGKGGLWLGLADSTLVRYTPDQTQLDVPAVSKITGVVRDESGAIWIGTRENGIYRYGQGVLTSFLDTGALDHTFISDLSLGPDGSVWVASGEDGIARIQGYRVHTYGSESGLPADMAVSILADPTGTVWIGTKNSGAWRLFGGIVTQPPSLRDGSPKLIQDMAYDREGSVWMATNKGLNRLRAARFRTYGSREGLPSDYVYAALEASDGTIWVGTDRGAARVTDGVVESLSQIGSIDILSLAQEPDGSVWLGTFGQGLYRWKEGEMIRLTEEEGGIPANRIFALHSGPSGIWMGTRKGVARLTDSGFETLTTKDGLGSNEVTVIHETGTRDLWVGTYDAGLHLVKDGEVVSRFLPSQFILSVFEDRDGDIWAGIRDGGLAWIHNGILHTFGTKDGMLSDNVLSVVLDEENHVWTSSNVGVSRISKTMLREYARGRRDRVEPEVFTTEDGLRGDEFNGGTQPSGWVGADGILWFASATGLVSVDPQRHNDVPPRVVIERLVAGSYDGPGVGPILLEQGARRFEFTFSAPSYVAPAKTGYEFKLDGYDRDWHRLERGRPRAAQYTNLSPGAYTFRVRAQNADGVWSREEAVLAFRLPSFYWQTAWFRLLSVLAIAAAAWIIYHRRMRRMRQRAEELERLINERTEDLRVAMKQSEYALEQTELARMEAETERERAEQGRQVIEQQADQLREMDRIKTRFFNNISHEFRTPLTLNIGPMENALLGEYGEISRPLRRQMDVMLRNSRRLLRLINQLLDLSKLESGRMRLKVAEGSALDLIEGVVLSFTPFAERKGLELTLDLQSGSGHFLFDPEALEKVFFNLVSNAVKFTPDGGAIRVCVREHRQEIEGVLVPTLAVSVKDSGVGIPKADLAHIFDRFHQVDGTVSKVQEGTGIGLALVRELVELHGGRIRVESDQGAGTEFVVTIPMEASLLGAHEVTEDGFGIGAVEHGPLVEMAVFDDDPHDDGTGIRPPDDAAVVLVVDDSPDIRDYVSACLAPSYNVIQAEDGKQGLEKARATKPDLIVSDVLMPNMTGFELCRALRADEEVQHIPVVLVTSKASPDDKIEGLESGAQDYVAKPFSARELLVRVGNLIRVREQKTKLEHLNSDLLSSNAALRKASEMKSQLLSIASHDMKNPLTAIREFARILREEATEAHQTELLDMIFDSSNDMLGLISQLLDSVELEEGSLRVDRAKTDLVDLAERVVERNARIADRKSQVIHTRMGDPDGCTAAVDAERVREAMDNLVSNAIKYSPLGSGIFVSVARRASEVVFSVRDEGPGLTEEDKERAFGKFQRLSAQPTGGESSTGLGLSIVKQIAELHGGAVWVESDNGEGSTFSFSLPVASPQGMDRPARARKRSPGAGRNEAVK